jgi:SAM-dependent methyltransferase
MIACLKFIGKLQPELPMSTSLSPNATLVIQQNISYYDWIATQYDDMMNLDPGNALAREVVADTFLNTVLDGLVLDFGGGTGKDLGWLSKNKYKIVFCEPSPAMREKAIRYNQDVLHYNDIVFLDDAASHFMNWPKQLPFTQKADALLCNFAVINCIPNLESLFKSLSLVSRPRAHLFILALNNSFRKRWQTSRAGALLSVFPGVPVKTSVEFQEKNQLVYLYTLAQVKRAAADYFDFVKSTPVKDDEFQLIQFIRRSS